MREKREGDRSLTIRRSHAGRFSLTSMHETNRVTVHACGRMVLGDGADDTVWSSHIDNAAAEVALDLSCVSDMDARGIGLLADLARRLGQRGKTLSVIAANSVVGRLVELSRLKRAIPGRWNQRSVGGRTLRVVD